MLNNNIGVIFMPAYEDFTVELGNNLPALILGVLLAVTLIVLIVVTVRFKMQQYSIFRRDSMDREEDSVILMTIHSAKGLEFPVVYVVGMEEGLFPGLRSIGEQDEMEEERRLCYVAFTRAKNRLVVSHARQRMLYGKTTANRPSRFLEESGLDMEEPHRQRDPWSDPYARSDSGRSYAPSYARGKAAPRAVTTKRSTPVSVPPAPLPELSVGQRVHHNAFGDGTVIKMTPMGGDQLLEIRFDSHGAKKLMLKAAARYLQTQ